MKLTKKLKTRLRTKYGPWAVVSGATSGIGQELAWRLAESGLHVLLHGRNEVALARIGGEITERYAVETRVVAADLSSPAGVEALLAATASLDVGMLVASAGFGTSGKFEASDLAAELEMLHVNCEALMVLTHHFARRFVARGGGGIVLMSSMVGFQGTPNAAHYAATKAYVQALGEALYLELRPQGVAVLAAAPGPVESGFGSRANLKMGKAMHPTQVGVPILQALGRRGTVLPGLLTKVLVGALRTVPRWAKVRIMQAVMGGFTSHQQG